MILSLVAVVVLTGSEPSAAALAPRFSQVQDALPGEQPSYEGWTLRQLEAEVRRLDELRPSLAGPITLLALGGVAGVIDLIVVGFGGLFSLFGGGGFAPAFTISVSVVAVIAAGLLAIGAILLRGVAKERSEYGRQLDQVQSEIERLKMGTPPPTPPPNAPPPSMQLPVPMQVMATPPLIAVTLARF